MKVIPWEVREGKILSIMVNKEVINLKYPINFAEHKFDYIVGYLNVIARVGDSEQIGIKEKREEKHEEKEDVEYAVDDIFSPSEDASVLEEDEIEDVMPVRTNTVSSLQRETPADSYRMPDDIGKWPYVFVPKECADFAWKRFNEGMQRPSEIKASEGWKWNKTLLDQILAFWRNAGLLIRISKGKYKVNWPSDTLRDYIRRKSRATTDDIQNLLWVPRETANEFLTRLENEKYIKKHPRKELWKIAHRPEIHHGSIKTDVAKKSLPGPATVRTGKYPPPEDFVRVKEKIVCNSCTHHYFGGWQSGNVYLCAKCYMKHGGKPFTRDHSKFINRVQVKRLDETED